MSRGSWHLSIRVRAETGFFTVATAQMLRGKRDAVAIGHRVSLSGMRVEVLELTDEGLPREVVYRFDGPLEDASLRGVSLEGGVYIPATPPEIGTSVVLK